MTHFSNFQSHLKIIVMGANGGIGRAFITQMNADPKVETICALSRKPTKNMSPKIQPLACDFSDDESLAITAKNLSAYAPFDIIIIATGWLHGNGIMPEKSNEAMTRISFEKSFNINVIGPSLAAKHFLPLLRKDSKAVFTALSARVGSIRDNRLGGWHAYRASKAALNMTLKTISIECARRQPNVIIAGLHPGTVDTNLSQPFQRQVPKGKLFTAKDSAQKMLAVINGLTVEDSGNLLAWDGQTVPF